MTARDLKNATGEVVRTLRRGESILLTFRGKPVGRIEPLRVGDAELPPIPSFDDAWDEIEAQLTHSKPHFASWTEAEDVARGRR
jgi:prevent-host-death family protein